MFLFLLKRFCIWEMCDVCVSESGLFPFTWWAPVLFIFLRRTWGISLWLQNTTLCIYNTHLCLFIVNTAAINMYVQVSPYWLRVFWVYILECYRYYSFIFSFFFFFWNFHSDFHICWSNLPSCHQWSKIQFIPHPKNLLFCKHYFWKQLMNKIF